MELLPNSIACRMTMMLQACNNYGQRDIYLTAKVEMEVELIVLHSHLVVLEGKCAES